MSDIEQLIETAYKLSNTLSMLADNERKFGYDLCYRIEQLSYDMNKSANDLKDIRSYLVGGVA